LVFLKDGASELCVIVTTLMFKIFEEERTPEQWKVARIFPFFKKRDKEKKSNLCSFTKVYEKLLLHWFQKIQEKENVDLKGSSQYGFKKNFSTETASLEIQTKMKLSNASHNLKDLLSSF
jgi:hypothetical protein